MRFLSMWAALSLASLATSSVSSACSLTLTPLSVGSSFKVKVSGYQGPVKGLRLNLTGSLGGAQSAVTDDNGIASFYQVPSGTQYLRAEPDYSYGEQLEVKPNRRTSACGSCKSPGKRSLISRSARSQSRPGRRKRCLPAQTASRSWPRIVLRSSMIFRSISCTAACGS